MNEYSNLVTGRQKSLFADDLDSCDSELRQIILNSKIAVVGAAGSIGSDLVRQLVRYKPREMVLFDLSENNLVELVRDLRSSISDLSDSFRLLPIGMGSSEFRGFFNHSDRFDYFFNLSALKHVRSEKDIYSLSRMVRTNIIDLHNFLTDVEYKFKKVFSVSSDKSVNPANLMGASKMVMEKILLWRSNYQPFSSARFANVAFSDGSLLHGILRRIEKRQPIAAPTDIKRFFISGSEAGELCLLSGFLGKNREVFIPKLEKGLNERYLSDIARDILSYKGYEPYECDSESESIVKSKELISKKKWPCYFSKSNTTGEKPFEEFSAPNENVDYSQYKNIGVISLNDKAIDDKALEQFIEYASELPNKKYVKKDLVTEFTKVIPSLSHIEKNNYLDNKM